MFAILGNNLAEDGTTTAIKTNTNIKRILVLPTIRGHVLSMPTMTVQLIVSAGGRCIEGSVGFGEDTTIGALSYAAEGRKAFWLPSVPASPRCCRD